MNVENINKVADAIERHSIPWLGFNMEYVTSNHVKDRSGHKCGTTGCIAGWACALDGHAPATPHVLMREAGLWRAARYLGLGDADSDLATRLFTPANNAKAYTASPKKAVAVLRHLATTGKVDWSIKP